MLRNVGVNFRVGRLHLFGQLFLCISRRQYARLLELYLQLDGTLLVDTGCRSLALANQHLAQLPLHLLDLLVRNLTTKLRVLSFGVADEEIKLRLVCRLLKELFNFLIRNIWTSLARALRFEIVFGDYHRPYEIQLSFYFRLVADSLGAGFFGDCQELAQVVSKIFSRV